jgi:hypothetical protein
LEYYRYWKNNLIKLFQVTELTGLTYCGSSFAIAGISSFVRNNDKPDPVMQINAPVNELLKIDKD